MTMRSVNLGNESDSKFSREHRWSRAAGSGFITPGVRAMVIGGVDNWGRQS